MLKGKKFDAFALSSDEALPLIATSVGRYRATFREREKKTIWILCLLGMLVLLRLNTEILVEFGDSGTIRILQILNELTFL